METENLVEQVAVLSSQIAELNDKIKTVEISGSTSNNLKDQRDQYITELSKLIDVNLQSREYGVIDVSASGIPLVIRSASYELDTGYNSSGAFGISIAGTTNYRTEFSGGKIGGLLSLKNEIIADK